MISSLGRYIRLLICVAAILWGGLSYVSATDSVPNTSYNQALEAFNAGDFEQALSLVTMSAHQNDLPLETRALKNVMAAEILSARVMLGHADNPKATAKSARGYAEMAIELAPNHQYAQLQYTVADGLVTRLTSPFKVWRKKLSSKTLAKIDSYRAAYPDDPRGQALLGAWHLGVIEKAGVKNGAKWFGASQDGGISLYEAALKDAPDDTLLAANYFLALASICDDDAGVDARLTSLSQQILTMRTPTALERGMVTFVEDLSPLIGQHKALEKASQAILAGKPL